MAASIRPAETLVGATLVLRNATVSDAEFILSLRSDPDRARHLSAVSGRLEDQVQWLRNYAAGSGQAYFIIEHEGRNIGAIRLYDARGDSFCWGSWILVKDRPRQAAVESLMMVFAYAVDWLGFRRTHFDVRVGNSHAIAFYDRLGAKRTGIDGDDILLELDEDALRRARTELGGFLPDGIVVTATPQLKTPVPRDGN